MSKTCDRCGKELTERDRTTICLECEVALAEEENERLETENAALREQLEAANKRADAAVEKAEKYAENLSKTMHKAYEIFAENEILRAIAEAYGYEVAVVGKEERGEHGTEGER